MTVKLVKSQANQTYAPYPPLVPGLQPYSTGNVKTRTYADTVRLSRYFYQTDPIASTVTSRIAEIAVTKLRNRRKSLSNNGDVSDEELNLFNGIAAILQPHLQTIILSYLIDGMSIPQYEITRVMGNRVNPALGRTRYYIPQDIWVRDTEHIRLYKTINGQGRRAVIVIPPEDINFVTNNGTRSDGVTDIQAYNELLERMPEYVAAIKRGETVFPLTDPIIFRKLLPYSDYPIPYLSAALDALDHKRYIKMMDRSTASRAIEAIRHVTVGSDEYPADDEDIKAAKDALEQTSSVERVYNLFTNHTIKIEWVVPPFDVLLDNAKYEVANADIFFALGFPRILTVGETEKSNSADNKIAATGVMASIVGIQNDIIEWIKYVYADIADRNNITRIPEPYFSAIQMADITNLLQYAQSMIEMGVISKDTAASYYGSSFESELDQRQYEKDADIKVENDTIPNAPNTNPMETNTPSDQSGIRFENNTQNTP